MKISEEEIRSIIKSFVGDDYVENGDCVLGYMTMAGVRRWVTEIYAPDDGTVDIQVMDPAFEDEDLTAEMVEGYILRTMEQAVPQYCLSIEYHHSEKWMANVTFSFN